MHLQTLIVAGIVALCTTSSIWIAGSVWRSCASTAGSR